MMVNESVSNEYINEGNHKCINTRTHRLTQILFCKLFKEITTLMSPLQIKNDNAVTDQIILRWDIIIY